MSDNSNSGVDKIIPPMLLIDSYLAYGLRNFGVNASWMYGELIKSTDLIR